MNFFSIDPGIGGTGYARFASSQLVEHGILDCNHPAGPRFLWEKCSDIICVKFRVLLTLAYQPNVLQDCFFEEPQFFQSFTGYTAATSGSLHKLTMHYGRLWEIARHVGYKCHTVAITAWKGQLSKEQTECRIARKLGRTDIKSHAADAVGIGLYLIQKHQKGFSNEQSDNQKTPKVLPRVNFPSW